MIVYLLLALIMSAATWILGWWGVVLVAGAAAYALRAHRAIAWKIALSAAIGWALLLIVDAAGGPLALTASTVGGVMKIPGSALMAVTLLFPALLAWSAAVAVANMASAKRA